MQQNPQQANPQEFIDEFQNYLEYIGYDTEYWLFENGQIPDDFMYRLTLLNILAGQFAALVNRQQENVEVEQDDIDKLKEEMMAEEESEALKDMMKEEDSDGSADNDGELTENEKEEMAKDSDDVIRVDFKNKKKKD